MGIIKWWNDRKGKSTEVVQDTTKPDDLVLGNDGKYHTWNKPPEESKVALSDIDRVTNYFASGGEIVDLSNKPRIEGDGFPPDAELLTPFNRAHEGTRAGLNALMRGGKR